MLDLTRSPAQHLSRDVTLRQGTAHALPFADASFDTVVCTFGLCAIPALDVTVDEMVRVLRPGRRLILADHITSSSRITRGIQRLLALITVPLTGEHSCADHGSTSKPAISTLNSSNASTSA